MKMSEQQTGSSSQPCDSNSDAPTESTLDGKHCKPVLLYESLKTNRSEIRLLVLTVRNMDASLELTLITVALEDQPEFHALSYMWGDPKVRQEVKVDRHVVSITANLCSALRHIEEYQLDCDQKHMLLWVDAVCINQEATS
jgi:hypothetical protein